MTNIICQLRDAIACIESEEVFRLFVISFLYEKKVIEEIADVVQKIISQDSKILTLFTKLIYEIINNKSKYLIQPNKGSEENPLVVQLIVFSKQVSDLLMNRSLPVNIQAEIKILHYLFKVYNNIRNIICVEIFAIYQSDANSPILHFLNNLIQILSSINCKQLLSYPKRLYPML